MLECVCVAALLCIGFHFVSERIAHRGLPSGDEGSWLSVSARFCQGRGFSTNWLEFQFQKPYVLPRPDDFRYPGLTVVLASVFTCAGISYAAALKTCGALFLCFCGGAYFFVRKVFGRATAVLTLCAMVFSLHQLQWNTIVYCEGLFGLVLAAVLILSMSLNPRKKSWWVALGAAIGILTMIRPNGILVSAGLIGQWVWMRRTLPAPARYCAYSFCALSAVVAPWCIRNMLCFGNPFHIAGGAGLLQRSFSEPVNESVFAFVKTAGVVFPFKATLLGVPRFFSTLNFFEHGLCVPLLLFFAIGCIRRVRFFSAFAATGFALSFVMCCYASYKSYAGVRYFSPFLPFVYAFGIHSAVSLARGLSIVRSSRLIAYAAYGCIGIAFLAPVFYPHRYYERIFAAQPKQGFDCSEHLNVLHSLLTNNESYCAGKLGQLNFLTGRNCVGVQEDFDSAMVKKMLTTFKPAVLALAPEELTQPRFTRFIDALGRNHCTIRQQAQRAWGTYFSIAYVNNYE